MNTYKHYLKNIETVIYTYIYKSSENVHRIKCLQIMVMKYNHQKKELHYLKVLSISLMLNNSTIIGLAEADRAGLVAQSLGCFSVIGRNKVDNR